ncbi:MAG: zeta toxin family protein [Methanobrevibacter sp.]|jgi:predicted ABC-type ATPase|nr:zeta toxin family protein [Candidatus Methanoflexus mossambicus]
MEDSKEYAKKHLNTFYNKVIENKKILDEKEAIFMAGSPGAGKTEVATELVSFYPNMCLIDADEFRKGFPKYNGKNSDKFQPGTTWLVGDIFKKVTDAGYCFLLDGTFALKSASKNIKRVLKRNYNVNIFFVYQDPLIAWNFVKIREFKEGRHVPKNVFINAYIMSRENIIHVKEKFGNEIDIHLLFKDFKGKIYETIPNTNNISLILPELYDKAFLEENLNDK